ncbi:hypothetical protein ABPG72_008782 [Tetrahymena utriculariae]
MSEINCNMIKKEKLTPDEDSDNLAQNMNVQNFMVHKFSNNQSYAKCIGDSSLLYPQTLSNFDKHLYMNQNSKLEGFDLSESQQQFYQFKKTSHPNLIYDSRRFSQFQFENKFHRQSEYPSSSRSINLESIEDFQRFNIDLANKSQYSIKMNAHSINQRRYQTQSMTQAKQYDSKEVVIHSQNKLHQNSYDKNKLSDNQVKGLTNQNDKRKAKKSVFVVGLENKTSHISIDQQKKKKDQNLLMRFLSIKIRNDENVHSIKYEKGIQIIKRLLSNKDSFRYRAQQKVKCFIEQLNLYYSNRNLKSKNQSITKIIGDKSDYHENQLACKLNSTKNKNQSSLKVSYKVSYQAGYFFKKFCCIMNKNLNLPLIMPTNPYLLAWDSIYLVIINSFLYIYSIYCFFGSHVKDKHLGIFFYVVFFTLALDRVIQFNTAFYEKDAIIKKRQKIIERNIFSQEFLIDLLVIATIFFKLLNQSLDSMAYNPEKQIFTYFVNCFIFLLMQRNEEKKKNLSDVITIEQNKKYLYRLFTQLQNVLLIAHISAIFMWVLYLIEEYYSLSNNWVNQANIQNSDFYEQYFYSLYWSITTLTTVGYGDIHIQNYQEAIFISIVMIIFSYVFAYSVSNIGVILQEIQKSSRQLQERLSIIQKFMNRKNVNSSLKSRVKFYLNYLASEQKNRDKHEEEQVLGLLSNKLRNEITEEINQKIINKYSLFLVNFQSKILKQVIYLMEEIIVAPNEIIFKQNDTEDQSIYFIQDGDVEIFVTDTLGQSQKVIAQITSDSVFGEISFFSGLPRTASARSLNLSTIYKINRQKFIGFLHDYPEDFQRYKMIQEQIICQNNLLCLYIKCYSCQQAGHTAINCPKSHINIDRQFQILKNNYSIFQQRKQLIRKKKRMSFHSFVKSNKQVCKNIKIKYRCFHSQAQLQYQQNQDDDHDQTSDISYDISQTSLQISDQSISQKNINTIPTIKRPSSRQVNEIINDQKIKKQVSQSLSVNIQNQEFETKKIMRSFSKNQLPELNDEQNVDQQNQNEFNCLSQKISQINNDCNLGIVTNLCKSCNQIIDQDSIMKQPNVKSQNSLSCIQMEQKSKDKYQDNINQTSKQTQICNEANEITLIKQNTYNQDGKNLKRVGIQENLTQIANQLERLLFYQKKQKSRENEALCHNDFNQIPSQVNLQPNTSNCQLNPKKNILASSLPKPEIFIQNKEIELFDSMKKFKRFFPHNNFDKVLKKLKLVSIQNSMQREQEKRQSKISKLNNQQQVQKLFASKSQLIHPTYASYGVFISNKSQLPIKFN